MSFAYRIWCPRETQVSGGREIDYLFVADCLFPFFPLAVESESTTNRGDVAGL